MSSERSPESLSLTIEFDESIFHFVVNHPDLGLEAWNNWMKRLVDDRNSIAVWKGREAVPSVSVHFLFAEDLRDEWPTADFDPVWFKADDEGPQEDAPEISVVPTSTSRVEALTELMWNKP